MYVNNTLQIKMRKKICIALRACCIVSHCQLPKPSSSSLSLLLPLLLCLSHQLKDKELTRTFTVQLSAHAERCHMIWSGHLLSETQIIKLTFENRQAFVQNHQCKNQTPLTLTEVKQFFNICQQFFNICPHEETENSGQQYWTQNQKLQI